MPCPTLTRCASYSPKAMNKWSINCQKENLQKILADEIKAFSEERELMYNKCPPSDSSGRTSIISLKLPEKVVHVDFLVDDRAELGDRNPSLLHGVALADSDAVVVERLVVNGHAERCADGVLTTVTLSD